MSDFTETQVDVHTEYRLVTEYAPGQFSVRMRGTYQDVLTQHAEDQADTVIAGKPQGIQLAITTMITGPLQRL